MLRVKSEDVLKDIKWWSCSEWAREVAKRYGYLEYMVCRYEEMLGRKGTIELLESFENFRHRVVIRVNTLRTSVNYVTSRLRELGFELKPLSWCDYCLEVVYQPKSPSIGATHEYLKGMYFVYRDPAPTIPPIVMNPRPGSLVADICAAPGGKATHLLQLMKDEGLLLANDKARSRIPVLVSHLVRMGFESFVITNVDARELPNMFENTFDYVLADVPCSAEGGIMFDPSRKMKTHVSELAKLVAREIELLDAAVRLAKPGGLIAYSTCSIAPEENEYVVSRVLEMHEDLEVIDIGINFGDRGIVDVPKLKILSDVAKCVRFWPHRHAMQGFFVCLLKKQG